MSEELLKQILVEMKDMKERITSIESNMATKEDLDRLEGNMEAKMNNLDVRMEKMEPRMGKMEKKLDLVAEQTAKLTVHHEEVMNEIREVKEDIQFLVHKSGEHERDIYKLKYRHKKGKIS